MSYKCGNRHCLQTVNEGKHTGDAVQMSDDRLLHAAKPATENTCLSSSSSSAIF